jgi:capsid protein
VIYSRARKLIAFAAAAQAKTVPATASSAEAERQYDEILRRRSEHAGRNSGIWSNALRERRRQTMTNPRPQCATEELQAAWDDWAERNVGYRASHGTLEAILIRAANAIAEQGSVWVQKIQTNGGPNGLRFQLWPDSLRERTRVGQREDGIEYTADGDIASVLFRWQSSSAAELRQTQTTIPGQDLFWMRYTLPVGQIGGLSPGLQALESDEMLRQLNVNTLESAKTRAAFTFIVEDERANLRGTNALVKGSSFTDAQGRSIKHVAPGTVAHAWNGAKVKIPDIDRQVDVSRSFERQIAAGTGYARELIGGEVGDANFSALRVALNGAVQDGAEVRGLIGWFAMLRWIAEAWVAAEALEGRSWNRRDIRWLQRPSMAIDRLKDVQADEILDRLRVVSRQELIRARGRNPRDVAAERAEDVALGLADTEPDPVEDPQPEGNQNAALSAI